MSFPRFFARRNVPKMSKRGFLSQLWLLRAQEILGFSGHFLSLIENVHLSIAPAPGQIQKKLSVPMHKHADGIAHTMHVFD
jgi:hypothetical protein